MQSNQKKEQDDENIFNLANNRSDSDRSIKGIKIMQPPNPNQRQLTHARKEIEVSAAD